MHKLNFLGVCYMAFSFGKKTHPWINSKSDYGLWDQPEGFQQYNMLHYRSLPPLAHIYLLPPSPETAMRNLLFIAPFFPVLCFLTRQTTSGPSPVIMCTLEPLTQIYRNASNLSHPLIGPCTSPVSSSFSNLNHFSPSPRSRPSTLLISPQPPAKWIMRSISPLHPSSHAHPAFFFTPFPPLQTSIGFTSPPSFLHHGSLTIWQEARLLVERISQRKRCQPTTLQAKSCSPRPRVHRVTALFRSGIMQILIPCR